MTEEEGEAASHQGVSEYFMSGDVYCISHLKPGKGNLPNGFHLLLVVPLRGSGHYGPSRVSDTTFKCFCFIDRHGGGNGKVLVRTSCIVLVG